MKLSLLQVQIILLYIFFCNADILALADRPSASRMAKLLCDEVTTETFTPVAFPGGSELVVQ